jgi:hypothetical protein
MEGGRPWVRHRATSRGSPRLRSPRTSPTLPLTRSLTRVVDGAGSHGSTSEIPAGRSYTGSTSVSSGDDYSTLWLPDSAMRERATIPSTTRDALEALDGFMPTRYREQMEDGRFIAELYPDDLRRVADGYGCPNAHCLARFKRRFSKCPLCGHELDVSRDIVDYQPDYWKQGPSRTSEEILGSA